MCYLSSVCVNPSEADVIKTMVMRNVVWSVTLLSLSAVCDRVPGRSGPETSASKSSVNGRELKCWLHEEYNPCGTACPEICENYGTNIKCHRMCVAGCFCKEGYVRDTSKRFPTCILPQECKNPPVCNRPGEHFSKCGTKCPLTCSNLGNPPICEQSCAVGCFCDERMVRNDGGACVRPEKCPRRQRRVCATKGEVLDYCGCEKKCTGQLGEYANYCPARCIQSCVCKNGLARHPVNGSCILPPNCPVLPKD